MRLLTPTIAAGLGAAGGGALALALGQSTLAAGVTAAFCAVLASVSVTDLRERRIPNAWTYPALLGAVAVAATGGLGTLAQSFGGLAVAGVPMALCYVVGRGRLGMGDVKLSALAGAVLGPATAPAFLLLGTAAGAVHAVGVLARGGGRHTRFSYGPALAVGAAIVVFRYGPLVS